jgi:pilus assembly protein FimV
MAYSKSKYVEAAQKLLNQGKVPQAIAEYQHILKYEPKDQVTLMTIGELYIRQGETHQAIDYFERLAQIFVGDGFLTKAIAVYKRIAKLAPDEIRPLEKLADLYVQQGVMSEARPLFVQLAELHLKNNKQGEAIALLKKLLLAEPDNLRVQIRLADLYTAMGQTGEAIEAYVAAAQRALARGDQAECEKLADRALKLDPKNSAAITVKARIHTSQGKHAEAAKTLQTVTDLHKGGEQTELLLDLYLKESDWEQAQELALRVFDADEKNFGPAQKVVEAMLAAEEGEQALTLLQRIQPAMTSAGEQEALARIMADLAAELPDRIEILEWLVEHYERTNDSFRLPDVLAHLGEAFVKAEDIQRAKQAFEKLVDRQPESESAKRQLNQVLRKLGHHAPEEAAPPPPPAAAVVQAEEEEPFAVNLAQPPAPKLPTADVEAIAHEVRAKPATSVTDAGLDEATKDFITQSLTDVDLFASYGLTQKAVGLLEAILKRAPRHTPTLEKLFDFVLGSGNDRRTAELAAQLEQLHIESGDQASAERFGELRRRFQRAAGLSDAEVSASVAAVAEPPAAAAPPPRPPAPEPVAQAVQEEEVPQVAAADAKDAVHEVDLSDEWASMIQQSTPEPPPTKPATPSASSTSHVAEFDVPVEEPTGETIADPFAEEPPAPEPPKPPQKVRETPAAKAPKEKPKKPEPEPPAEREYELVLEAEEAAPPPPDPKKSRKPAPQREPEPVAQKAAKPPADTSLGDEFLADLAKEIDELGLGDLSAPAEPPKPAARSAAPASGKNSSKPAQTGKAKPPVPASPPADGGPLKEVFDEFRAELGEMGAAEDEDLETHYNLGIAFREMGLLEEAISEFQKVAKATERGRAFRYTMQCCTFLGLCFMDKGQPGVAAIWYERALHTPDLDPESALALRYDLGVAQESAGEPSAALKSFSQVYAMNIDYRDVGERIAALQKPAR